MKMVRWSWRRKEREREKMNGGRSCSLKIFWEEFFYLSRFEKITSKATSEILLLRHTVSIVRK